MLFFGLLLGVVLVRKFPWRENVLAISWTVIVAFLALVPLTLATSPSLPIDNLLHTFGAHEGGAAGLPNAVSQDAYSVWPLVEYFMQGVTGFHQVFNPNNAAVLGPLTFQRLSLILTIAVLFAVAGVLLFRKEATNGPGSYLPYLAVGITAVLMLLFGLIATHFLLALPILLLVRRWIGNTAYFYVVVTWTITTFVTMYGDMGLWMSAIDYPRLAAANNAVTKFIVGLYTADRFITVGIFANLCAVIWLGYLTLRSPGSPKAAAPA